MPLNATEKSSIATNVIFTCIIFIINKHFYIPELDYQQNIKKMILLIW